MVNKYTKNNMIVNTICTFASTYLTMRILTKYYINSKHPIILLILYIIFLYFYLIRLYGSYKIKEVSGK